MAKEILKKMLNLGKIHSLKNNEMEKVRGGRRQYEPILIRKDIDG